jgi:3-phenylpropionate/trans-cinnamate dioxygenase ferredoxin subunit
VASHPGPPVRRFVAARVEDVPEGSRLLVEVAGRTIGIFNRGGKFYALLHRCPHLGGPLCDGEVVGLLHAPVPGDVRLDTSRQMLICPWHGWEFDLVTGQSYWDPNRVRARPVPIEVTHGKEIAEAEADASGKLPGPFVVETFPVDVEKDYIVVMIRDHAAARRQTEGEGQ